MPTEYSGYLGNPEQVIAKSELGHALIGDHKSYESILRP